MYARVAALLVSSLGLVACVGAPAASGPETCADADGDGIADDDELGDSDADGTLDSRDLDSDDDVIPDSEERGEVCGLPEYCSAFALRPRFQLADADGDGLEDREEQEGGTDACARDTDLDGCFDALEGTEACDEDVLRVVMSDGDPDVTVPVVIAVDDTPGLHRTVTLGLTDVPGWTPIPLGRLRSVVAVRATPPDAATPMGSAFVDVHPGARLEFAVQLASQAPSETHLIRYQLSRLEARSREPRTLGGARALLVSLSIAHVDRF